MDPFVADDANRRCRVRTGCYVELQCPVIIAGIAVALLVLARRLPGANADAGSVIAMLAVGDGYPRLGLFSGKTPFRDLVAKQHLTVRRGLAVDADCHPLAILPARSVDVVLAFGAIAAEQVIALAAQPLALFCRGVQALAIAPRLGRAAGLGNGCAGDRDRCGDHR